MTKQYAKIIRNDKKTKHFTNMITRGIFVKILAAPFREKCVSLSIFAKKARKVTFDRNTVTDRPMLAYPGNTFRPLIDCEKVLFLKSF
jgi:hypothetical protein